MANFVESFLDGVDSLFAWLSSSLKQYTINYSDLESADSETVLVNHDGTLLSIVEIGGIRDLIGPEEFEKLMQGLNTAFQSVMSRPVYSFQLFFSYDKENVSNLINNKSSRF